MKKKVSTAEREKILREALGDIDTEDANNPIDETPNRISAIRENSYPTTGHSKQSKPTEQTEKSVVTPSLQFEPPQPELLHRTSARQRKASLDEYREAFMAAPKIIDRQPVFVSRETRDRIDETVRRFGERKMSVSGFLENLARHHLETYSEDLEQWKRL